MSCAIMYFKIKKAPAYLKTGAEDRKEFTLSYDNFLVTLKVPFLILQSCFRG
jgi:hypothetical protein